MQLQPRVSPPLLGMLSSLLYLQDMTNVSKHVQLYKFHWVVILALLCLSSLYFPNTRKFKSDFKRSESDATLNE